MKIEGSPIHIEKNADIANLVLLPGDPLRAKYIAENFLTDVVLVTGIRNMLGFTGFYQGKKITVMGSGMGMPSIGIYAFELFNYFNVDKIIRIGTCGVVSRSVNIPEIILADKSYTESNYAYMYNEEKISVANPSSKLNDTIKKVAMIKQQPLHIGGVMTIDVFGPYVNNKDLIARMPQDLNILGEEMESFALFHIANSFHKEASCLLTAVDSEFSDKIVPVEERENSLNAMITLALDAIIS